MNRPARRPSTCRRFALRPLPLALAIAITTAALPSRAGDSFTNVQTVVGATISNPNANTTNVNQSANNAYIQAGGFNIAAQDAVKVYQPSATSNLLIQVTGYDPSAILGQLQANGRVFLSNPNGVLFGAGARIDVGSLVATNLSMDTDEFMRNRIRLVDRGNSQGSVVNAGTIKADGTVALVGTDVRNLGSIEASRVGLAALSDVVVDVEGDGLIFFQMSGSRASARLQQLGSITADGGLVELRAEARGTMADTVLNMDGLIQARSIGTRNGQVIIDGGSVGITKVTGTIDVQGTEAGETGGTVKVLGDRVALGGTALIDASGDAGGGTVLVGGNYQGSGDERRASHTRVAEGATIKANAATDGDGGTVVVWADGTTAYQGQIQARGGAQGGNGGTVEVSGKQQLAFWGTVDAYAAHGAMGTLLLDPDNIYVVEGPGAHAGSTLTSDFSDLDNSPTTTGDYSVLASSINASAVDVTLTATNNITIDGAISRTASGKALTLNAGDSIYINKTVNTNGGALTLNAGFGDPIYLSANITTGGGAAKFDGNVQLGTNVTIDAGSGNVWFTGTVQSVDATTARDLTITANTIEFDGALGGSGNVMGNLSFTTTNLDLGSGAAILAAAGKTATIKNRNTNGDIRIANSGSSPNGTTLVLEIGDELDKFANYSSLVIDTSGGTGGIAVNSDWTLRSSVSLVANTGSIQLNGSMQALNAGVQGLTISTNGTATIGNNSSSNEVYGSSTALRHFNVSANTINMFASQVRTSSTGSSGVGDQTYTGTMVLGPHTGGNTVSHAFTGNNITFSTIESVTTANQDLTVTAGGKVTFNGTVGAGTNKAIATLNIISTGDTVINTSQITSSGDQRYQGDVQITSNTVSLTSSTEDILFDKTVRADSADTRDLTLTATTATKGITFADNVGATAGTRLDTLTVNGLARINGASVNAREQVYNNNVTLGGAATAKALVGDRIAFAATTVLTATGYDLTLRTDNLTLPTTASVGGNGLTISQYTDNGSIGIGTAAVENLNLSQADLGRLASFGTLTIGEATRTATVESGITQLTLGRDTTFAGDTSVTLQGIAGATHDLTLTTSQAVFNGDVSGVANLTASAAATLNANLSASNAVSITGATTLATGDGTTTRTIDGTSVTLGGLATGTRNIAIKADTLSLSGAVTSSGSSASVSTHTNGRAIALQSGTAAADLEIGASTLALFAPFSQLTIGRSDSNSAISATTGITLPTATTLISGTSTIALAGVTGGGFGLTLTGSGDTSLTGAFANVASLTSNGGGKTVISTDLTTTSSMNFAGGENVAFAGGGTAITLRTGTLSISGGLDVNHKDTTLRADSIALTGTLSNASGADAVLMSDTRTAIRVNATSADTALDISTALLAKFTGFDKLTIGGTGASASILTGALTLPTDVVFASGGGNITLGAITGASFDLTTSSTGGTVTFKGDIAGVHDLATTGTPTAITIDTASIATTNSQTYNANVTLGTADTTLSAPTITISGGHTITAGANDLALRTDALTLGGASSTGGDLTLSTFTASKSIGVLGGSGDLQIDTSMLSQFTGFGAVIIGRADSTAAGTITVGDGSASPLTLPGKLQLVSGAADIHVRNAVSSTGGTLGITSTTGDVTIAGDIGGSGANLASLSIDTGGDITLQGVSIHATNATFDGDVVLANNAGTPSIVTTQLVGGTFTFTGAIRGTTNGTQILDATGATLTKLQGDVGTSSLGLKEILTGSAQVGSQLFATDLIDLGGSITLTGDTLLQAASVVMGDNAATDTFQAGTADLTLRTDALTVNLASVAGGDQWSLAPLTSGNDIRISTTGASPTTLLVDPGLLAQWGTFAHMTIGSATTGDIAVDHSAAISLGADLTLRSGSGDITILSGLRGAQALTIDTTGTTYVQAALGSSGNALTSLVVTGKAEFGAGSGVAVLTTGAQDYQGDVTIANATTLTTTAGGVRLRGKVDGKTGGSATETLTIDNTGGGARFDGAVGSTAALRSLTTNAAQINGGAVRTTAAQDYHGGVTLSGASTELTGSTVTIDGAVTGSADGVQALKISGNAVLKGAVGTNVLRLASLEITGASALSGASVFTTGNQTYTGAVELGANTTLTATTGGVLFGATVDGDIAATRSLTVNAAGASRFGGAVGGTRSLTTLTTDSAGSTALAGNVTTSGAQTYNDGVTIDGDITVTAGGDVRFLSTLEATSAGVDALTVNTSGLTRFAGTVGANTALATLETDSAGTTQLGGDVRTTGAIDLSDAITLTAGLTITHGGVLTFDSTVDGAQALTLDGGAGNAAVVFKGTVGGSTALTSLTVDGTSATSFGAGSAGATTTGAQQYGGAVALTGANKVFSANDLEFASLSGANGLTLSTNGLTIGSGGLSGSGALVIQTRDANVSIGVGGAGSSGTLQIAQNVLDGTGGFSSLVIGRADGTGSIDVGASNLGAHTNVRSGSGAISINGPVNSRTTTAVDLRLETNGAIGVGGDLGSTQALREISASHAVSTPTAISIAASRVTLESTSVFTLNNVTLTGGGSSLLQSSRSLVLAGDINLSGGGTLGLVSTMAPTKIAVSDTEYAGNNSLSVGLLAGLKEASAGIEQTGGKIVTSAGTTLYVRTTQGASINLMRAGNDIQGGISAVSGRIGENVNTPRLTTADGNGEITVGFVRVASKQINVLGQPVNDADQGLLAAGIEGDAVVLSADRINTSANNGLIRARLPYDNNQGTLTAVPGLTLELSATGLNANQAYGGVVDNDRIQVSVGNSTGGYITVRPKGGASLGPGFVSLGGSSAMRPFYDGSGKVTEVPIFYNGDVPQTPQEVGALSAVTAVIEESRRQRFEEAVRTENVSARLRSGVIAEVGAGRPATEGSDSIRMPASCTPAGDSLSCQ